MDRWTTYTGEQARQIIAALQLLIDSGELSRSEWGEEKIAKRIQRKLEKASMREKGYTMVPLTEGEAVLLDPVEAALWR